MIDIDLFASQCAHEECLDACKLIGWVEVLDALAEHRRGRPSPLGQRDGVDVDKTQVAVKVARSNWQPVQEGGQCIDVRVPEPWGWVCNGRRGRQK